MHFSFSGLGLHQELESCQQKKAEASHKKQPWKSTILLNGLEPQGFQWVFSLVSLVHQEFQGTPFAFDGRLVAKPLELLVVRVNVSDKRIIKLICESEKTDE